MGFSRQSEIICNNLHTLAVKHFIDIVHNLRLLTEEGGEHLKAEFLECISRNKFTPLKILEAQN